MLNENNSNKTPEANQLVRLLQIRTNIGAILDELIAKLSPFILGEKQSILTKNRADLEKMHEGCLVLKQKLLEFLQEQAIQKDRSEADLQQYLSKVRHDLRNVVNVINGYGEMIIEELQKDEQPAADAFLEMTGKAGQILILIDAIKSPETQSSLRATTSMRVSKPIPAELITDSEEFLNFKKKASILIVDDNEESCQILQRYLSKIDYPNIQVAYNGVQALSMLEKQTFDLILLDIDMPEMNGIEMLQHIKKDIIQQNLMVLMISAADTMDNTITCIRLGAVDFLPKPYNPDLLRVRIGSCIERKWFINKEKQYRERIEFERQRYENLMKAVFPSVIVDELTQTGTVQPAHYTEVAIMFADVVGFTSYCDRHSPVEILDNLQNFVEMCESVALENNLQKIKTIGDSFLASAGMLSESKNPVLDCIHCARTLISNSVKLPSKWQLRVGIHFGSVIGGIVGHRQYQFDIWGDVVNTAARIQTQAEPNSICMSKQAWERVKDLCNCRSLGIRNVRGKAPLEIFEYVEGG